MSFYSQALTSCTTTSTSLCSSSLIRTGPPSCTTTSTSLCSSSFVRPGPPDCTTTMMGLCSLSLVRSSVPAPLPSTSKHNNNDELRGLVVRSPEQVRTTTTT